MRVPEAARPRHKPYIEIVVGGMPYFGRRLTALLDNADTGGIRWRARYLETRRWRPDAALQALHQAKSADLIYLVGGQIERFSRPYFLRRALDRPPIVMHWVGSDVLHAREVQAAGRAAPILIDGVTHWAGATWLADELHPLGIRARWVAHCWTEPQPMQLFLNPDVPLTALAYLPAGREAFYGLDAVRRFAWALPEVRVLVVGTTALPGETPPNVRCLGWVKNMATLYEEAHILLRLPEHDGLSFMVQEALARGLFVIWNHPFPGVEHVEDVEESFEFVRNLSRIHQHGAGFYNMEGYMHVHKHHTDESARANLLSGFADVIVKDVTLS